MIQPNCPNQAACVLPIKLCWPSGSRHADLHSAAEFESQRPARSVCENQMPRHPSLAAPVCTSERSQAGHHSFPPIKSRSARTQSDGFFRGPMGLRFLLLATLTFDQFPSLHAVIAFAHRECRRRDEATRARCKGAEKARSKRDVSHNVFELHATRIGKRVGVEAVSSGHEPHADRARDGDGDRASAGGSTRAPALARSQGEPEQSTSPPEHLSPVPPTLTKQTDEAYHNRQAGSIARLTSFPRPSSDPARSCRTRSRPS